jgi:hypothetical protein
LQQVEPNASKLAASIAINYERARRLLAGSLPSAEEADAIAELFRNRAVRTDEVLRDLAAAIEGDSTL